MRQSNSAWEKTALASFNISLARLSSLTSRSKSLTLCASLLFEACDHRCRIEQAYRCYAKLGGLKHIIDVCWRAPVQGVYRTLFDSCEFKEARAAAAEF